MARTRRNRTEFPATEPEPEMFRDQPDWIGREPEAPEPEPEPAEPETEPEVTEPEPIFEDDPEPGREDHAPQSQPEVVPQQTAEDYRNLFQNGLLLMAAFWIIIVLAFLTILARGGK